MSLRRVALRPGRVYRAIDPPGRGAYRSVQTLPASGGIASLAAPAARIAIADLLP